MSPRSSEFGSGYATCLRQFTFHAARLDESVDYYATLASEHPDLFRENRGVEVWANGASDHLYELHRPRRGVPVAEWEAAKALQDRALDIGHGFRASSKSTPAECHALLSSAVALLDSLVERGHAIATLDDCLTTDRALGLAPIAGDWSCTTDLKRERSA